MTTDVSNDGKNLPLPNRESSNSGIHWAAILGGGAAATATTLTLIPLGSALGFSSFSVWDMEPDTGTTLGAGIAIWLVITQWISAGLGGYLAGRTRVKWSDIHSDEVFFRDTAHGFLSWAVATIFVAGLTMMMAMGTIGAGTDAAAKLVSGAASGSARSADLAGANLNYYVDTLYRNTNPERSDLNNDEAANILMKAVEDSKLSPNDRAYLASQISTRTGLAQPAAEARVDAALNQLNDAKQKAVQAAEKAREAASVVSWGLAISLVLGAFIASVAGAIGGRQRDEY